MDVLQSIDQIFDAQLERIKLVTGKRTQEELADFFGIDLSSILLAKRKGRIPPEWLVALMQLRNVMPEWIVTGSGPCYASPQSLGFYEPAQSAIEREQDRQALARSPSRMLAEELLRRIVLSPK